MGRMMIDGDTMSWEGELQKKQGKLAQAVAFIKRNIPKFKVVEAIPDRAHGGIIRYTEANPSEQHDPSNEPHQISLPSSPRVKWKAWMRQQLEPALEQNAKGVGVGGQMRSRFRNQGGYKLASENKEERNWFNVIKNKDEKKPIKSTMGYNEERKKFHKRRQEKARRQAEMDKKKQTGLFEFK